MTVFMYEASVGVFRARLKSLAHVLAKGEANAAERKIDPQVFVQARLAPDMLPLVGQVRIASDHAKGAPLRLAGRAPVPFEDDETSFADLQARISRTIALLDGFSPEEFEDSDERDISLRLGGRDFAFKGRDYLLGFAMPNFYFHVTTAYAILRHNGVPIGKRDFMHAE
jgi:hypothetical protein